MKNKISDMEADLLVFFKNIPKPHTMKNNRVRLTDEAAVIITQLHTETHIPLTQIASEMIKYASEHVKVEIRQNGMRSVEGNDED